MSVYNVFPFLFVINLYCTFFSMPNFKVNSKRCHHTFYQSRKYQRCKSYISPTTTTIANPNDNINQNNNHIFGEIHISYINICNNINCDSCAQNFYNTFYTTKLININSNRKRNRNINRNKNTNRNSNSNIDIDNDNNNSNNNNSYSNNVNNKNDGNKNITLSHSVDQNSLS